MIQDLGRLRITSVIIHEVPLHSAGHTAGGPIMSEVESPLEADVRTFLRDRIVGSLASAAYEVEVKADSTSPVPGLVIDNLTSSSTGFVAMSQEMANHLYLCQKGSNPGGLLTVCETSLADRRGLAILKLEKEEGARIFQQQISGGRTFRVEHLRELMLTDTTRVYKVGLFVQTGDKRGSIDGLVCDKQRLYNGGVAHFFLEQFLGCRLK
ncbi:MAG: nucleoid-associated protein, partial [Candidatus Dormiibacterota bacterium]